MALYDVSKEDLMFDPACLGDNSDDDGNLFTCILLYLLYLKEFS